jgi:hypothetical protein
MKTEKLKIILLLVLFISSSGVVAQNSIQEFVDKTGKEKIQKGIVMDAGSKPVTAGGFQDGHGKNVLLVSKNQIPDTVALITLYIYDLGSTTVSRGGNAVVTTHTWLSPKGGNALANGVLQSSINNLKESFKNQGVVLLTPEEYLNTPEKRNDYYKNFTPEVSKLGKFLGNLENKHTDIAVAADDYRCFDIAAAGDHLRSQSYGGNLAKKLGVKGVLSIAVELQSDNKNVNMHGVKMALHGPNLVPKEDKKYVAQNMGNGYYEGQLYTYGYYFFPKPIKVGSYDKKKIEGEKKRVTVMEEMNFEGVGVIMESFVDKFHDVMNEAIEKAGPKYNK